MLNTLDLKKLVLASAVVFCASVPSISQAFPDLDYGPFHPILGADFQHRDMEFQDGFGDNLWKETYPQMNLYLGMRFGSYFGFVVGHENSKTRSQTVQLSPGETLLGIPLGANFETHQTSGDIKGTYAQIMGYYPIPFFKSTEIFLGVGAIHNRLNLEDQLIAENNVFIPVIERTYHESDTHAKIELGVQKIICNHFGLRIVGGWENTSEFKNLKPIQVPTAATEVNLKDTWTVGAGFFWIF